jgi:spore coat polysaccharide biosynthesis protein SpsF
MTNDTRFSTEQEEFWAGSFGSTYIGRNNSPGLLASNLNLFSLALRHAGPIRSCIEFGANIGMNLRALRLLYPDMQQQAIEINHDAAQELGDWLGHDCVFNGSITDWEPSTQFELVLIKGVLIHIHPDLLAQTYEKMYAASSRLILVCEYYNPTPVSIAYRGHTDRLFKRDFCGELLDKFNELRLLDYGFSYRRDPVFPQDDITWFLLEKRS